MFRQMLDAQSALSFLLPQLTHIEAEVYRIQYAPIRYAEFIPVDTSAPAWTPSVTYFSLDKVGEADWFNSGAQDVPKADVVRAKYETTVKMAAAGYGYGLEELNQAMMLGINLTAEKAEAARFAAEKMIDRVSFFGASDTGFTGLCNNPTVTITMASATGTGGATQFNTKTAAQVLADINGLIAGIYTTSLQVEMADTVLLPNGVFQYIAETPFNTFSERTILSWLRENNTYTLQTGQPLKIAALNGLDTAGTASTGRMIAYWRNPSVVKMHLPMPFAFYGAPMQTRPLYWERPGIFRFGGVDVKRPGAFRYMDGV